jgi:hypothetical protein
MREILNENIWAYAGLENTRICIPINCTVKRNGENVMGKGMALEAKRRYPGIAVAIGRMLNLIGRTPGTIPPLPFLMTFPTKYNWWDKTANFDLIRMGFRTINTFARQLPNMQFYLPRVGCGKGTGNLLWIETIEPLAMRECPHANIIFVHNGDQ